MVSVLFFITLVSSHIASAFLDIDLVAVRYVVADPVSNVLGSWVERQDGIEILMIERTVNETLYLSEIDNHTVLVELLGLTIDGHDPVMAVQVFTLALV